MHSSKVNEGRRLRDLREYLGLTQKDFSLQLDLKQSALSMIETGERKVPTSAKDAAVFHFRVDPSFFDLPAPSYEPGELNYRRGKLTKRVERMADRTFGFLEAAVRNSTSNADSLAPDLFIPNRSRGITSSEIKSLANDVRNFVGLNRTARIPNVTRVIETVGGSVVDLNNPGLTREKLDGISSPRLGDGKPVVALSPQAPGDRRRFSAAHELGHLLLHGGMCGLTNEEKEREADSFAAEFLLPSEAMRDVLEPSLTLHGYAQLKAEWAVSIQALIMRAKTLGTIDYQRSRSLFMQLSSRGWRKEEPVFVPQEKVSLSIPALALRAPQDVDSSTEQSAPRAEVINLFE